MLAKCGHELVAESEVVDTGTDPWNDPEKWRIRHANGSTSRLWMDAASFGLSDSHQTKMEARFESSAACDTCRVRLEWRNSYAAVLLAAWRGAACPHSAAAVR